MGYGAHPHAQKGNILGSYIGGAPVLLSDIMISVDTVCYFMQSVNRVRRWDHRWLPLFAGVTPRSVLILSVGTTSRETSPNVD